MFRKFLLAGPERFDTLRISAAVGVCGAEVRVQTTPSRENGKCWRCSRCRPRPLRLCGRVSPPGAGFPAGAAPLPGHVHQRQAARLRYLTEYR